MTKVKLGDYVSLQTHKVDNITAVNTSYVSTENLQPNKNGVLFPAASMPSSGKVNFYGVGDILVSNIRPYFKKIWMAINPGTHSSDVLNFRTKSPKLTQEYLYIVLESDSFFDYVTLTSKGTKMPRGDKDAIMDFEFSLPSLDVQQKLSNTIMALERKILMSKQVNDNLLDLGITYTEEMLVKNDYPVSTIKSMNLTVSDHVANGSFKALKDNVEIVEDGGYALFLRNTDLKADLNGDRRFVTKSSYEFLKKSRLFGGEVIISNVGDVGSVYHVPYLDVPMVAGNNVVFLQSEESWLTDYLYFYFKSRIGQHDIDSITSGSAQQKFNKTDFRALEIPVILEHDVTILTKLIDNLNSNTQEIRTLMDTRDTLLKKLLN